MLRFLPASSSARGSVQYHHCSQLPFLDSLTVNGSLTSRQLDVREKQIRTQVRNVAAHYSLKNGNLSILQAHANLLGGAANGRHGDSEHRRQLKCITAMSPCTEFRWQARSNLRRPSQPQRCEAPRSIERHHASQMGANHSTIWWLKATCRSAEMFPAFTQKNATQARFPFSGVVHGTYSAANQQIELTNSYLQMPQTSLTMNGTVSQRSRLAVAFQIHRPGRDSNARRSFSPGHHWQVKRSRLRRNGFVRWNDQRLCFGASHCRPAGRIQSSNPRNAMAIAAD